MNFSDAIQEGTIKVLLKSKKNYVISGHSETFGTLLRFHTLTDIRIGYVIIRNCSTDITP